VLSVESLTASGRWVDPGETNRFQVVTYADLNQIDHYTIEIAVQDWTDVP